MISDLNIQRLILMKEVIAFYENKSIKINANNLIELTSDLESIIISLEDEDIDPIWLEKVRGQWGHLEITVAILDDEGRENLTIEDLSIIKSAIDEMSKLIPSLLNQECERLFKQIYGLKARKVKKLYGSSVLMDFGKELEYEVMHYGKLEKKKRGEYQLWIHHAAWRIDENLKSLAGSEDSDEIIENSLKKIVNKKLISVTVINPAFDLKIEFEDLIIINTFTMYAKEPELSHWMLFTPERKVFKVHSDGRLNYEESGE